MSRLNDLLRELRNKEPALARDLEIEVAALADRRAFGLNFERHVPEAVELPGRKIRKGDKVRILPPRGETTKKSDAKLWRVVSVDRSDGKATLVLFTDLAKDAKNLATSKNEVGRETCTAMIDDLVVVAEFRDPIYPGLMSTGKIERGGDKPFHTVINAENFHALQMLLFTHRAKVDAIYIDPPYNTGAKDWKYNNDYVEGDDLYRHSKWLAFMERRLLLAKELLNPSDSVLIVTIDEKESLRLGLLLEQTFPDARIQMVTSVISSQGSTREGMFSRADEYLFFVFVGAARLTKVADDMLNESGTYSEKSQLWFQFIRGGKAGKGTRREDSKNLFYPLFVDPKNGSIVEIGDPVPLGVKRQTVVVPRGTVAVWPLFDNGGEGRWRTGVDIARRRHARGLLRVGRSKKTESGFSAMSIRSGTEERIDKGEIKIVGHGADGGAILDEISGMNIRAPKSVWNRVSHNAGWHGTKVLTALLPGRGFPFPKSLYAVEDALRFIVAEKRNAVVVDFFSGSGTTAHAVMRLNKQDGGVRRAIIVTNNEVAAEEQKALREQGLRPGDIEWEKWGICEYITKPRIGAAITGKTPDGNPIEGNYKFTDEFPIAHGFEENVEFFTLTYEAPLRVSSNREYAKVAPLLWLRAGARGRRIDDISIGWDVADYYGVLADFDKTSKFLKAIKASETVRFAYIVTDEDRIFEMVAQELPDRVEPVRLYQAYLRNFEIESGRGAI
jgi:adenine-specific DNA-methyltransferase